jgi:hypothetical protein
MGTHQELLRAARAWETLADEAETWARYETERGRYAGVHLNKANTYRRTAESLRLEALDGVQRCACHLVPFEECRKMSEGRRA